MCAWLRRKQTTFVLVPAGWDVWTGVDKTIRRFVAPGQGPLYLGGGSLPLREQPSGPSDFVHTSVSGNFEDCASTEVQTRGDVSVGRDHQLRLDVFYSLGMLGTLEEALLVIDLGVLKVTKKLHLVNLIKSDSKKRIG